jgi:hypothetical protein
MIENWVSLPRTIDFVKTETGSSIGPARQTLISICESGEVRARWAAHVSGALPAIHKRDWIGADIDWKNFRVVKADGAGMAGVDFSEDDLNSWAARNSAKTATTETEAPAACAKKNGAKRPRKRGAAEEAVKACFPKGVPNDVEMPDGPLCAVLSAWLKTKYPALPMHDKTILRAAGRVK